MNKRRLTVLLVLLALVTTQAVAQWGGSGAWGAVRDFLKRCTTHIVPSVDSTYDLGTSAKHWRHLYIDSLSSAGVGYLKLDASNDPIVGNLDIGTDGSGHRYTVYSTNAGSYHDWEAAGNYKVYGAGNVLYDGYDGLALVGCAVTSDSAITTTDVVGTPQIKTDTVTPTDLTITTGAAKTLVLATSIYDDLQFQVSNAKVTPNNLLPSWETFTANTSEFAFSIDDEVDTQANEIPHWWKEGTTGHAHLHITTKAVPAQEQKAQFTVVFAYADASPDANKVWVEAPLTAELTIPINTLTLTNFYLDLGDLTLTNYLVGAQIRCRVTRVDKTAEGTEYVGDIFITQCGIHLEKTRMGSRAELTS